MKSKIILGTVQLGIPYGINNTSGKPSESEAFNILSFAYDNGLSFLDTADAYGNANAIIGRYGKTTGRHFQMINKFKVDATTLYDKLLHYLELIGDPSLYCYMYHDFATYEAGRVRKDLSELRNRKLVQKLGVSLYSVDQLKKVVDDPEIDIIQLPVNLFDLSDEKIEILKAARRNGKECHARSVFFQGLFFRDVTSLTGNLASLKPYLEELKKLSKGIELKKLALNFVLHQECVDRIVIGVDSAEQLAENIALVDGTFDTGAYSAIKVKAEDAYLLNPGNWQP